MPALELRSIDAAADAISIPSQDDFGSAALWSAGESQKRLCVDVFVVRKGKSIQPRHHRNHMTTIMCWRGSGTATLAERSAGEADAWDAPFEPIAVEQYTSIVVPRGALYQFTAAESLPDGSPAPDVVLVVVHPLLGTDLTTEFAAFAGDADRTYAWVKDLDPDRNAIDPETDEKVYDYDADPTHRAKRMRIWGRDGIRKREGAPDIAKTDFHVVAYCFGAGQENPSHFHPFSVEFMLGLTGDTLTYTRAKRWDGHGLAIPGWEENRQSGMIRRGDTALVRLGDLHRYVNHTNAKSIVLAMQTPQPIMHTLEHETDF